MQHIEDGLAPWLPLARSKVLHSTARQSGLRKGMVKAGDCVTSVIFTLIAEVRSWHALLFTGMGINDH